MHKMVECYNPVSNSWRSAGELVVGRFRPKPFVYKDVLYVIGGATPAHGPTDYIPPTIERYDADARQFTLVCFACVIRLKRLKLAGY